jgi:hypothetical protein
MPNYAIASYIYDKERRRTYLGDSFQFRGAAIPNLTTAESMRYLGAPIANRTIIKLKSKEFKFKEMEILLGKIMSSRRLTVQKIDPVKTFLLPSIDFLLLNREVGRTQLQVMDKKIRGMIDKELKIKRLPIKCHHTS